MLSGPISAPAATVVVPCSWTPGSRTTSGSSATVTSTQVLAGSTTVTPASIQRRSSRRFSSARTAASCTRSLTPLTCHTSSHSTRAHRQAVGAGDRDQVGEVQLALGVRRAQPGQRGPQERAVQRVDARVDLAHGLLVGRRIGLLDDLAHGAVGIAQHPPVAERVGRLAAEQGDRGARAGVLAGQRGQRGRFEQRHVAVADQHRARQVRGQLGQRALHGVPGAQALLLHRGPHRPAQLRTQLGQRRAHLVTAVPDHRDQVLGLELGDRVHGVREQAAAADRVQHLRSCGAHPGALTGGQHDGGARSPAGCGGVRAVGVGHGPLPVQLLRPGRGTAAAASVRSARRADAAPEDVQIVRGGPAGSARRTSFPLRGWLEPPDRGTTDAARTRPDSDSLSMTSHPPYSSKGSTWASTTPPPVSACVR